MTRRSKASVESAEALALIGAVYDAAVDPALWKSVAERVATFVHGEAKSRSALLGKLVDVPIEAWPATSQTMAGYEHRRLEVLLPHLSRAIAIMQRLDVAKVTSTACLEVFRQFNSGILLLDARGCICFANAAARRILEGQDGLEVSTVGPDKTQRLHVRSAELALNQAIAACSAAAASDEDRRSIALKVPQRTGTGDLVLQLMSFLPSQPTAVSAHDPAVLALITKGGAEIPFKGDLLRQMYGLTAAEAKLIEYLFAGEQLKRAAQNCGITLNTAQTHMKRVLEKTGATRQPDLMRLVRSLHVVQ